MENYALLAYFVSAILAIVIFISKARRQRQLEAQIVEAREKHSDELNGTRSDLGKQIDSLRQKIDETDEAKLLRNQLVSLKEQLAQATDILEKARVDRSWIEMYPRLKAEREEMERTLARLAPELEEATRKLVSWQSEIVGLNDQKRELAAELARMESERALLADELTRFGALAAQIEEAGSKLGQLNTEVRQMEAKKTQLGVDCIDLEAQKVRLNEEIGRLNNGIEGLNREIERLNGVIETQRPKAQEYDSKAKALESLDEFVRTTQALQNEIAETNRQMLGDLKDIAKARREGHVTLRQAAFKGLVENPPFTMPTAPRSFESEARALENLTHYVREVRKYDLPTRLLYAFHTSLKTSDISSLTVMAGVSGTGKSALPDLYAKAMGFHMVMLSVEPRWDSPKDLMGFFNYVTNRYEATPLAKALFQFQGYHNQNGLLPTPDLKNYMLMAMLDEMNLARIEYYFSEFLSKLELRRGGDMEDEDHRRKVAMRVFPGAETLGKDDSGTDIPNEPYIDLFADYNTLFVGTMNEDETTQSLSDKVIDRANVLYFGRPGHLKPKTADAGNGCADMLRRETWQSWWKAVETADALDNGRLHAPARLLARLNDQLAGLGRPFAHRSYQAMLAYMANYPYQACNIDENDRLAFFSRPLADQISMRVMPKLRGLDLAQHAQTLEQVGTIVREVGDATLETAFKQAVDRQHNRSGFFHWQGLEWAHGE